MRWREAGSRATASAPILSPYTLGRPRAPGARGGGNTEQGGVAADLADHGVAAPQRRPDQRTAHVPGVEQRTQRTEAAADRPQQPLGQGDLPGVPDAAAQAGHDRHRARPVAAGHDGAERDEGLAQQEGRAVRLPRVVEPHRGAGRLGRATRRQGVVDHGEAPRPAGLAPDDAAQRGDQAEQAEAAPLQHPVVGLPAPARRHRQERPGDVPAAAQHGSDKKLGDGAPGGPRDGPHDLPHPCGQRRREPGLALRCHGAFG